MFLYKNMGLSSKQVSGTGDGFDWTKNLIQTEPLELPKNTRVRQQQQQHQQHQLVPLKCPRCDSTNTKFCYYNNYNRSQPRHFCKSCRRHWTNGGTLRNVPVGGGRKNKRHKTNNNNTTTTTNNNNISNERRSTNVAIQSQQQQEHHLPFSFGDQKNMSEILQQAFNQPKTSIQTSTQPDYINSSSNNNNNNNNNFLGSTLPLDSLIPLPNFPFTGLSSFDNNPSSTWSSSFMGRHFQPSNVFNYSGEHEIAEDPSSTIASATTISMQTPWQIPATTSLMDSSSYWNWEDLNTLISTDLTQPSDDSQNKQ